MTSPHDRIHEPSMNSKQKPKHQSYRHQDNTNTLSPKALVTRALREKSYGHPAKALWFTGLSGSGKSTLAHGLEDRLFQQRIHTFVFDGDNVRHGLCSDLGFSPEDRRENVRRVAEVVRLFLDAGVVCLCALVSPSREDRELAQRIIGNNNFIEIFVRCPLEVCESRDEKGYYRLAREGKILNYTGVSALYEEPTAPDIMLDTNIQDIDTCINLLEQLFYNI